MSETERLPDEFLNAMAEVIKLIGHPLRLRILEYLDLHGECTVNTIVAGISGQQSAVSQHLNKMRMAGIVACRREGAADPLPDRGGQRRHDSELPPRQVPLASGGVRPESADSLMWRIGYGQPCPSVPLRPRTRNPRRSQKPRACGFRSFTSASRTPRACASVLTSALPPHILPIISYGDFR